MTLLKIENPHANVGNKEILKGISLTINAGEMHAIMGPNGSAAFTASMCSAKAGALWLFRTAPAFAGAQSNPV